MTRWTQTSAIWGTFVWLGLFAASLPGGDLEAITRLLLLAILVLAPLCLSLVAPSDLFEQHYLPPYRATERVQPFAAMLALVSSLLRPGILAALLAAVWLAFTALVAWFGLHRFLSHRFTRVEEVCIDAGLIYLPVGSVWLVLSRLGANPLGFSDTIVLLTAVHFHYTGFIAPVVAGMVGRQLADVRPGASSMFRVAAIGLIAGTPLVAIGITFSPLVEVAAVTMLVAGLLLLSFLTAFVIAPAIRSRAVRALLIVSPAASVVAMLAAGAYGVGQFTGAPTPTIPQMVAIHGWVNALGFALCGLIAWSIIRPKPIENLPARGIP